MSTPVPAPARAGAATTAALLTTWVFALLPANLVPSIIEKLVYDLDVDVTLAGAVATCMTLANAASVLGTRHLVQHGHRVLISRIGLAVMMLAFASGALWPIPSVTMVALVVGGLGAGLVVSAATAAVSATPDPDRSTTIVMTINRLVVALAFLMVPILGGGIRELFLILAVPGILGFIGAQWLPGAPQAERTAPVQDEAPAPASAPVAGARRSTRAVGWLLAVGFGAWSITDDGVYGLVGVIVGESDMAVGDSYVSNVFALSIFCGLGGALIAPVLLRLLGRTTSLIGLLTISATAKLGLMTLGTPGLYATASATWGFVFGAMLPLVFGLAAAMSRSGGVSVLVNGVYIIGVALGPLVATQLFEHFGSAVLAAVMTSLAVITGVTMIYASNFASHFSAEAETATLPEKIGAEA